MDKQEMIRLVTAILESKGYDDIGPYVYTWSIEELSDYLRQL